MKQFPEREGMKVRDLLVKHCRPRDAKPVLRLIDELRTLVEKTYKRGRQHSRIVDFALKVVHGISSIFWSSRQEEVTTYGRSGKSKKAYQPKSNNRLAGVLTRA